MASISSASTFSDTLHIVANMPLTPPHINHTDINSFSSQLTIHDEEEETDNETDSPFHSRLSSQSSSSSRSSLSLSDSVDAQIPAFYKFHDEDEKAPLVERVSHPVKLAATKLVSPLANDETIMKNFMNLGVDVEPQRLTISGVSVQLSTPPGVVKVMHTFDHRIEALYKSPLILKAEKSSTEEEVLVSFGVAMDVCTTLRIPSRITLRMVMASQHQLDLPVQGLYRYLIADRFTHRLNAFERFFATLSIVEQKKNFTRKELKNYIEEWITLDRKRLIEINRCKTIRDLITHVLPANLKKFSSLDAAYYTALFNKSADKVLIPKEGSNVSPQEISMPFEETVQCLDTLVATNPYFLNIAPAEEFHQLRKEERIPLIRQLLALLPPGSFDKHSPIFYREQLESVLNSIPDVIKGRLLKRVMTAALIKFQEQPQKSDAEEPMYSMQQLQSFLDEHRDLSLDLKLKKRIFVDFYKKYFDSVQCVQIFLANQIGETDRRIYENMSDSNKNKCVQILDQIARPIFKDLRQQLANA